MRLLTFCLSLLAALPIYAGSSNSMMDISPDGRQLIVAGMDHPDYHLFVINATTQAVTQTIPGRAEGTSWVGNGPLALATFYHRDEVAFIDTITGKVETISVADEPYGIVVDRAGKRAWVSHDYPGIISEIDVATRKVIRTISVSKFIRGIALSPDEQRLYVTEFYTAKLIAIDIASGKIADQWPGDSEDNMSRNVVLHPTRPKAYLSHWRSRIHVFGSRGSIFPHVSICTLRPDAETRRTSIRMDTYNGVYVTSNPWESAITADGKYMYTIYAATNDVNISELVNDDYREIRRVELPTTVGKHPRAVRVSPDGKRVYIYQAMDFSVGVYDAMLDRRGAQIPLLAETPKSAYLRGQTLFNTSTFPMTRDRWVACASCHVDGQHDGRVWQNPEGLRRGTGFLGMRYTHPLHWSADRDEVQDFEYTVRGRLMGGPGLFSGRIIPKQDFHPTEREQALTGVSGDLDALAEYCNDAVPMTLSPHIAAPGKLSEAAQRGKSLFYAKETNCSSCHNGPYYTDSSLSVQNLHDVGTGVDSREKMGTKFDTPTLLGTYRSTAYLHHGQAATLEEVLTKFNADDKHGKTTQLSANQVSDMVAFLKSLPYEMPETPVDKDIRQRKLPPSERRRLPLEKKTLP